jgi:hypothetical protein
MSSYFGNPVDFLASNTFTRPFVTGIRANPMLKSLALATVTGTAYQLGNRGASLGKGYWTGKWDKDEEEEKKENKKEEAAAKGANEAVVGRAVDAAAAVNVGQVANEEHNDFSLLNNPQNIQPEKKKKKKKKKKLGSRPKADPQPVLMRRL